MPTSSPQFRLQGPLGDGSKVPKAWLLANDFAIKQATLSAIFRQIPLHICLLSRSDGRQASPSPTAEAWAWPLPPQTRKVLWYGKGDRCSHEVATLLGASLPTSAPCHEDQGTRPSTQVGIAPGGPTDQELSGARRPPPVTSRHSPLPQLLELSRRQGNVEAVQRVLDVPPPEDAIALTVGLNEVLHRRGRSSVTKVLSGRVSGQPPAAAELPVHAKVTAGRVGVR